ncbi:MAG: hypothetical protein HY513_00475, partial [Candidatus Aenigmarchaeota archaeon]|nr:hypothetical protein [Candidatus Aenigmarchaeota archaeon]
KSKKQIIQIEEEIFELLNKNGAFVKFDEKMNVRALMWYQKFGSFIAGSNFLDLGGGDGR